MGLLTLFRRPLYRALKVWHTLQTWIQRRVPHPKIEKKNKCVLKWSICKIQCFKTMFYFCLFFLVENRALTPPHHSGKFHSFFFILYYFSLHSSACSSFFLFKWISPPQSLRLVDQAWIVRFYQGVWLYWSFFPATSSHSNPAPWLSSLPPHVMIRIL